MREIALTQGLVALVDDEDFEAMSAHNWCVLRTKHAVYAKRTKRAILMHREIMNPPEGMVVDHINFNGLDNRRSNLRVCFQHENVVHTAKRIPAPLLHSNGKYRARLRWKGQNHHLGYFVTREEAVSAIERFRTENYPSFAVPRV